MARIPIILDSRLRIPHALLTREAVRDLQREFTYENPDFSKWKAFKKGRPPPKHIASWQEDGVTLTLPRGGIQKVRSVLLGHGYPYSVDDRRVGHGDPSNWAKDYGIEYSTELYPFQLDLVDAGLRDQNCLWRSPTGSGKTEASLAFIHRIGLPALVIVHTTNLFDQWIKRAAQAFGISRSDVGQIKGSKRRPSPIITIGMAATLKNCINDFAEQFGTVVCDEVQLFAAPTLQEVVDRLPAKYRLGVSANEKRADRKEFLIYDQFGDVAAEVTHEELVEQGFIHEVEVRAVPTNFEADWYRDLKPKKKVDMFDVLLDKMSRDEQRNELIARCVQWALDEDEQVIVLSGRREHCHLLDQLFTSREIPTGLFIGGQEYRGEFNQTLDRMQAGWTKVGVGTYQAIGIGFDFSRIARGVCATPVANNSSADKLWRQYRGRFCRTAEGKKDAALYYLWDRKVYGHHPLTYLCRWNKRVKVLVDGEWIDGRRYAKEVRSEEEKRREEVEDPSGLFE